MPHSITNILKAVADPTRRELFHVLVTAAVALPITQLSGQFEISRQGVTKHLKTLEAAGLVHMETKGRERFCSADATPLKALNEWLKHYERFWDEKLDDLGAYLDDKA